MCFARQERNFLDSVPQDDYPIESPYDQAIYFHPNNCPRNELRRTLWVKRSLVQQVSRVSISHRLSEILQRKRNRRDHPFSASEFLSGFQLQSLESESFMDSARPHYKKQTKAEWPNKI